jgi:predicted nucleotidyltransferase
MEIGVVAFERIQDFADRVAERFRPHRVILFDSYAYGTPRPDSDVDYLVVMDDGGRPVEKILEISAAIDNDFPIDILVRNPKALRERLDLGDPLLTSAVGRGRVLYEAPRG